MENYDRKLLKGGGNLVSTLRKSYSLSDLSEPDMHRSADEMDAIVYDRSNHMIQYRPMPTTNQRYVKNQRIHHPNGLNRSASSSRTVDVYYEDMISRNSDNYE